MKKQTIFLIITVVTVTGLFLNLPVRGDDNSDTARSEDMAVLKESLSLARGMDQPDDPWPRTIEYTLEFYDAKRDAFQKEKRTITLDKKPVRIIPHAVGVTEILWAICPRKKLVAFNELAADPEFCVIADEIKKQGPLFQTRQTESVIGYHPDLIFTVFYSNPDFLAKLEQAKIPFLDLGYFGTIDSLNKQILLVGEAIGEEGNAHALVERIANEIRRLRDSLPKLQKPVRVLYYDEGGYVPGKSSNFDSICSMIDAINVGAEQGVKSWRQIDYETLLQWDPDVILVPAESNLQKQLTGSRLLAHGKAIRTGRLYYVPGVYLRVDSQYILLSAHVIANILYGRSHEPWTEK